MRFNKLDMNLLAALDILLRTRSVSQAAEEMFITQSAMSNALGRLRLYFEDPLLVQVGRRMELSPLAVSLQGPVREIMIRVESAVLMRPNFDPETSDRQFSIVLSDYSMAVLGPNLARRVAEQGAGIQLNLRAQNAAPAQLLERGEVDVLIVPEFLETAGHAHDLLFEDELVILAADDGPWAQGAMTPERFQAAPHVVMEPFTGQRSFAAIAMEDFGLQPRVVTSTFSFSMIPGFVRGTDRVALIQRKLAELALPFGGLSMVAPPVAFPKLRQTMRWHQHRSHDPGLIWLREVLKDCVEEMEQSRHPRDQGN